MANEVLSELMQGKPRYLNTASGQVPFTPAEFATYSNLAKVVAKKDEHSSNLFWHLIQRSGLPELEVRNLITMVKDAERDKVGSERDGTIGVDGEPESAHNLSFFSMLLFLKSIAHYQRILRERPGSDHRVDKIFFIALHDAGTDGTRSLADLRMKYISNDLTFLLQDSYEASVTGYELYSPSSGYESAHVRFRICTTTTTTGKLDILGNSALASDASTVSYKSEVTRRYKDFEFLVRILLETAPGCVVPPLPPKNFELNSISESVALQRGHELTLFLGKITSHPVLSQSPTLKVFLEATVEGYKAWREICIPKPLVAATSDMLSKASAAAESGLKEMSRQLGSLFGMVGTKVLKAAEDYKRSNSVDRNSESVSAPPTVDNHSSNSDSIAPSGSSRVASASYLAASSSLSLSDRERMEQLVTQLHNSGRAADACSMLLDAESRRASGLSFLGGDCLGWSAEGSEPCLDVQLATVGEHLERIATAQAALLEMQRHICATPWCFLGRYCTMLQNAVQTYATAKGARDAATRDMLYATDALRRTNEKYPTDSVQVFRAQEEHAAAERRSQEAEKSEQQALARLQHDREELEAARLRSMQDIIGSMLEMRASAHREQAEGWEALRGALLEAHFDPSESSASVKMEPNDQSGSDLEDRDVQRAIQASLTTSGAGGGGGEVEVLDQPFNSENPLG